MGWFHCSCRFCPPPPPRGLDRQSLGSNRLVSSRWVPGSPFPGLPSSQLLPDVLCILSTGLAISGSQRSQPACPLPEYVSCAGNLSLTLSAGAAFLAVLLSTVFLRPSHLLCLLKRRGDVSSARRAYTGHSSHRGARPLSPASCFSLCLQCPSALVSFLGKGKCRKPGKV